MLLVVVTLAQYTFQSPLDSSVHFFHPRRSKFPAVCEIDVAIRPCDEHCSHDVKIDAGRSVHADPHCIVKTQQGIRRVLPRFGNCSSQGGALGAPVTTCLSKSERQRTTTALLSLSSPITYPPPTPTQCAEKRRLPLQSTEIETQDFNDRLKTARCNQHMRSASTTANH